MVREGVERRLTTILAADVVGYSRLMAADEAGTFASLKALRRELFEPKTAEYHGRVVKLMGDGTLMEFGSVVDAVTFAVDLQRAVALRNADVPEDQRITYRIGINIGDVIIEGDDIYGDGVNVAARLEGLAKPGGICISGKVHEEVRNKLPTTFEDMGEQQVKNISEPIRVYRVASDALAVQTVPSPSTVLPLPDKPSIAVLPFTNMSGDPEQEYFSDGITEDIITALSNVHWLFVIARNSTFTYKGSAVDVMRVARELGVRYVVEGSVRKAANKVRITAQLVDGTTGNHVWAERYDRELDDIFALQDEITETIVGRIDTELRASEINRARRKPPANLDTWEHYQRGLWHFFKLTKEGNEEARNLFRKAVERDPSFALAHAGIAFTCFSELHYDYGDNPAECLAQGLAAGEQAVALGAMDGFTHFALGRVLALTGQGDRAVAELEKSVSLNSSFAHGYLGLGTTLNWYGQATDAIPKLNMAMRLSPHDPLLWAMQCQRASSGNNLENYDEAEEWARKAANTRADKFWPHTHLAVALTGQNRRNEARVAIEVACRVKPDLSLSVIRRLMPHYHPEYLVRRIDALREAGLPE